MGIRRGVDAMEQSPEGRGEAKALPVQHWEAGLEISGDLLEIFDVQTQFGEGTLVAFNVDGQRMVFGCPAKLKTLLQPLGLVPVTVRCIGKGIAKKGQSAPWEFRVWADGIATQEEIPF